MSKIVLEWTLRKIDKDIDNSYPIVGHLEDLYALKSLVQTQLSLANYQDSSGIDLNHVCCYWKDGICDICGGKVAW